MAGSVVEVDVPTVTVSKDEVEDGAAAMVSEVEGPTGSEVDEVSAMVVVDCELDDGRIDAPEEVRGGAEEDDEEDDTGSCEEPEDTCPVADVDATWDAVAAEDRPELVALRELTLKAKAGV